MIVSHIIGNCPSCGGINRFGNVSIDPRGVLRGCWDCKYKEQIKLPLIQKKIIYLDQFFFSCAFRENDKRFVDVAEKITELASKQL